MGQRGSAVEVLAHDAIEVKNVVAACRAARSRCEAEETAGALSRRLRTCDLPGGSVARRMKKNRLRGVSLPACNHSAGRLAVFSIHS